MYIIEPFKMRDTSHNSMQSEIDTKSSHIVSNFRDAVFGIVSSFQAAGRNSPPGKFAVILLWILEVFSEVNIFS